MSKQRKKHLTWIVISVAATLVVGYLLFHYATTTRSGDDSSSQSNAAESGWKKYTSKKYGLSFETPKDWTINESDPTTDRDVNEKLPYKIDVLTPSGTTNVGFNILKGTLNEVVSVFEKKSAEDYEVKITKTEWNGYDARIAVIKTSDRVVSGLPPELNLLFVKVGENIYMLPARESFDTSEGVSEEVWRKYLDSIEIKN